MNYRVERVVRGNEKLFILCAVSDSISGYEIKLSDVSDTGLPIPCLVLPYDSDFDGVSRVVCCTADVVINNHNFLLELYSGNELKCSFPFKVSPRSAKWESRFNYRIRPELSLKIRDYDQEASKITGSITFDACIQDEDSYIVRAAAWLPYRANNELNISIFDMSLKPLDIEMISTGEFQIERGETYGDKFHGYSFSMRFPMEPQHYLFLIEDSNNPNISGFDVLTVHAFNKLRNTTFENMNHAQFDSNYPKWFASHKVTKGVLKEQAAAKLPYMPTFSIIVPLFNTPKEYFVDMVDSVRQQSYPNWQLVLVNASPENENLSILVDYACESDKRIESLRLEDNFGISLNTNRGIDQSSGDFVCFFDHDDVLEPNILFEYAKYINSHPNCDLLYCDEDKLLPDGSLSQPFFKPNFNIDLLRNCNYICHMLTIRKALLDSIEPNSPEFDGAQDHNLTLEAVEVARHVGHIPQVLYHWRVSKNSTAGGAGAKSYTSEAGIKAVSAHLRRLGIKADVAMARRPNTYKVIYRVPDGSPLVSIVIPSKDHVDLLERCLRSIISESTYENYEIVVIENNSTDPDTFKFYQTIQSEFPEIVRVVYWDGEFNFSKLMNFGRDASRGEYLLLLNNDTKVITPNWLEIMLGICAREDVGAVGVRLYYPDDTIQHAGVVIAGGCAAHLNKDTPRNRRGYFAMDDAQQDLSAVTAACVMTKKVDFDSVGGFTEELAVAFNDVDYCLKLREKNLLVVYTPEVELYHYESVSRGAENSDEKKIRFHREVSYMNYRWADYYIKGDPYFNPNFDGSYPRCCYYHLG